MNYSKHFLIISLLVVGLISCENKNNDLNTLKDWMTGSFDSEEQSKVDTNFFNIHLEMVEIWKERNDAEWLYVEQAASWSLEKPYRQRVYKLSENEDGKLVSEVFTFNNPLRFAGAYNDENPLSSLTPDSLSAREGCAIIIERQGEKFVGSTVGKECTSNLRGASYAASEVQIEKDVLTSWDRGFNENNEQVWGAETGPYIFKKKINNQ